MCGIAGIIDFENRAIDPGEFLRVSDAIAHRGPDDEGHVLINQAARFPLLERRQPGGPPRGRVVVMGSEVHF